MMPLVELRKRLTAAIADPVALAGLPDRELDLVLRAARRVRLLGWLAVRLEARGSLESLPEAAVEQLLSARAVTEARARVARWELDRIAWALRDSGVTRVVVMKGCAYELRGLPNAPGRLFADVDLMVGEADLDAIELALTQHGWRAANLSPYDERFYRAWSHELPALVHAERDVEVDIHHNIRGRYAPFRVDAAKMLAAARPIESSIYQSLDDSDLVLHAMTHLMYGGDQADKLRDLVDIDLLLRHFTATDGEFWQRFPARARELNLGRPAYYSLRFARRLLATPVPGAVFRELEGSEPAAPVRWLMDRLVPAALFPQHPEGANPGTTLARFLLFVRSHWVSMPLWMLLKHLSYKFYVRHVRWRWVRLTGGERGDSADRR